MGQGVGDQPVRRWEIDSLRFRTFLKALTENIADVCDDVWLESKHGVEFLYAVDFQELYNYMYPFWVRDPTLTSAQRRRFRPDDALAAEMLEDASIKFVILDGTYMELWHHLSIVRPHLGRLKALSLQRSPFDAIERFERHVADILKKAEVTKRKVAVTPDRSVTDRFRKAAELLGQYEESFARLADFLRNRVFKLEGFFSKKKFRWRIARYQAAFDALSNLRSAAEDVKRNEADALNLAALASLNEYFREGFETGQFDKRFVVRLFTHTRVLFELGERAGDWAFDLRYVVNDRYTPVLATPRFLYVKRRCAEEGSDWCGYTSLMGVKRLLASAGDSLDTFMWHLTGERQALPILRDELLTAPETAMAGVEGVGVENVADKVEEVRAAALHPLVWKLTQEFMRLAPVGRRRGTLPMPEAERRVPIIEVIASANRVTNQVESVRYLLREANPAAEERLRKMPIERARGTGQPGSRGLFVAENLGYVREKDGVLNPQRNRVEHRIRAGDGGIVLAMDLYRDYYKVSWPTSCDVETFTEAVSHVLQMTQYAIDKDESDATREGIIVMEASGKLNSGPLSLPINESSVFRASELPIVLRVNARQAAFVCETATGIGTPLTGVIGTPDTVECVPFLYGASNGVLPEATLRTELVRVEDYFSGYHEG